MIDDAFLPCVGYALDILTADLDLPVKDIGDLIIYGTDVPADPEPHRIYIIAGSLFVGGRYGSKDSLPALPLAQISGVPLLYGTPRVERRGDALIVYADIVASAYFMLTRYEETVRRQARDEHGRFPGKESLAYRAGFLCRPIVDEYAALLRQWLGQVGVDVAPPKRRFSLLLTHDIDMLHRYRFWWQPLRLLASALAGRASFSTVWDSLATLLGVRPDPFNCFARIVQMDAAAEVPHEVAYFFLVVRDALNADYDIDDADVRESIAELAESASIGLHASYQCSTNPERIAAEKAVLETASGLTIKRNRHHYLAWREVEDGRELAAAGIDWDSSLGYADIAGFRLGVCHPIQLFDPVALQITVIVEHPLMVMDVTLERPGYMGLTKEGAYACCQRLMRQTHQHGGEFVMLWHNTNLVPNQSSYLARLYTRVIAYANELEGATLGLDPNKPSRVESGRHE